MPIITPAYPSMCATHNIGKSSMVVIQQELEKGAQVTEEIMVGRRQWKDLFTKHTFFTTGFRYYLTVIASSRTKTAQNAWSGFVESRVRVLVNKLEMHPSIALARPFNKGYDREHRCKDSAQVDEVIFTGSLAHVYKPPADGEELVKTEVKKEIKQETGTENDVPVTQEIPGVKAEPNPQANMKSDPTVENKENDARAALYAIPEMKSEEEPQAEEQPEEEKPQAEEKPQKPEEMEIFTTNHYIGLQLAEGAKSLDLSREVNDWKAMCTSNELYKDGLMFLSIQHIKNTALPDDVFEPGEVKPRPVKKGLKRGPSDGPAGAGRDQRPPPAKRQQQQAPGQGKTLPPAQRPQQQQQQQQQQKQQQQPASTAAAAAG